MRNRIIYIASDGDENIGFVAGHLTQRYGCAGELKWIDVGTVYRRKGIASQLVQLLANWFISQKAFKICVDPGNEGARQFYKRNGALDLNEHWLFWEDMSTMIR